MVSPHLYCTQGNWFQLHRVFKNSSSKGHSSPMLAKCFFYTSSISRIYKSVTILQWICEMHFLGSLNILFGEEYKDEGEDKDWITVRSEGSKRGAYSQAMRTWALRLLVVPAELQATHWHQKSSGPNSSSTCCRVISMLASLTTRPVEVQRGRGNDKTHVSTQQQTGDRWKWLKNYSRNKRTSWYHIHQPRTIRLNNVIAKSQQTNQYDLHQSHHMLRLWPQF